MNAFPLFRFLLGEPLDVSFVDQVDHFPSVGVGVKTVVRRACFGRPFCRRGASLHRETRDTVGRARDILVTILPSDASPDSRIVGQGVSKKRHQGLSLAHHRQEQDGSQERRF